VLASSPVVIQHGRPRQQEGDHQMAPAGPCQIRRMEQAVARQAYRTVLLTASAEEQAAARGEWGARLRQILASARP
jgi:hypothetical protein